MEPARIPPRPARRALRPRHAAPVVGFVLALLATTATPAGAVTLTGVVRNEAAVGLGNVDIDCIDLCTGDNLFLAGDKTAADGSFSVVVPTGTYDVHFTPPAGSTVAAGDLQDVVAGTNVALGVVTLHPGRLVSGTVFTPALGAAAGVDLKFVDRATDHRVYLSKDVTNASGQYAVRVPAGTWDIDFRPPAASAFADRERLGLVVGATDVSGLRDTLRSGFVVTGSVRDKNGNRVKNVDLDVFDTCTGERVPTAHDNTDANGGFSLVVPAGTYLIDIDPPRCKGLEAARMTGVVIARDEALGQTTLRSAVLVSGIVHDHTGAPLAGAKLKFHDATAAGNPRVAATGDRTDANGAFGVLLPANTYDISIEPPVGVPDQVGRLGPVGVVGATDLGVITLAAGVTLSGHLQGPGGVPARNVNINVVDALTRAAQHLAHDATDAAGDFTVVVAPGTYDVQYDPPACSGLAPTSQDAVTVTGATTLPARALVVGVHATGTVLDAGALPVANVDLDFYPAGSTDKIYTPNDQTAADGTYDVLVPPGVYDLRYIPSSLTRLRPESRTSVSLATSQALPTVTLLDGLLVSGRVLDAATLAPLAGVTVDFLPPGGSTPLLTSHHTTALAGTYSVAVAPGTWDIRFTPPPGSPDATTWRRGVVVTADLALTDELLPLAPAGVPTPGPATAPALSPPWPNPARGEVHLSLVAPEPGSTLTAWDVSGRRVAELWRGPAAPPTALRWNATRDDGSPLPSGLYLLRLARPGHPAITRRVMLLR